MAIVQATTIHLNPGVKWEDVQKLIKKGCDLARKHGVANHASSQKRREVGEPDGGRCARCPLPKHPTGSGYLATIYLAFKVGQVAYVDSERVVPLDYALGGDKVLELPKVACVIPGDLIVTGANSWELLQRIENAAII